MSMIPLRKSPEALQRDSDSNSTMHDARPFSLRFQSAWGTTLGPTFLSFHSVREMTSRSRMTLVQRQPAHLEVGGNGTASSKTASHRIEEEPSINVASHASGAEGAQLRALWLSHPAPSLSSWD